MGVCQHVIKYGLCLVMFEAHANDITGSGFDALTLVTFGFFVCCAFLNNLFRYPSTGRFATAITRATA